MKKWSLVIILLIVLVLSQINIFVIDRYFWFDESFSAETIQKYNDEGGIDWRQHDVHPPVYYSVLRVWSVLNPGVPEHIWLREFSVLCWLLFIFVAYAALSKAFGWRGEVATLLIAFLSTYVHYGTEARQYMLVLFFSAVIFYGVVTRFKHWAVAVASFICIALLPITHYLSFMAVPFYIFMYAVYSKKKDGVVDKEHLMYMATFGIIGLLFALSIALPQMARVHGTWFQQQSISSFMSANIFSFFYVGVVESSVIAPLWIYGLFTVVTIFFAWLAFKVIGKKMSSETTLLLLMGAASIVPLAALAVLSSGVAGSFNLYHHRFFLVVTWLVPATVFIVMLQARKWIAIAGIILVVLVSGPMLHAYMDNNIGGLPEMQYATPCWNTAGKEIWVGHESQFTMLSWEVFGRENGCNWHNFLSTRASQEMMNGGGGDVMDDNQIYFNWTLPDREFYYVQLGNYADQLGTRNYSLMLELGVKDEGMWATGARLFSVAERASLTARVVFE